MINLNERYQLPEIRVSIRKKDGIADSLEQNKEFQ